LAQKKTSDGEEAWGKMRNLSVKMRIWLGFSLILLILAAVGGFGITQVRRIQAISLENAGNLDARRDVNAMRLYSSRRDAALRGILIRDDATFVKDFDQATKDMNDDLKKVEKEVRTEEGKQRLSKFEIGLIPYMRFQDNLLKLHQAGKSGDVLTMMASPEIVADQATFRDSTDALQSYLAQLATHSDADQKALIARVQTIIVGLLLVGLVT
jgi:CHASE3 domain sensor protein